MKIFNKIKSILFDDEDSEIPVIEAETKVEKTDLERIPSFKPTEETEFLDELPKMKEDFPTAEIVIEERDVFQTPNTFNFPLDVDDQDFAPKSGRRNQNILDLEKESRKEYDRYSIKKEEPKPEVEAKVFKASPIISPIYGVMDKNYKKEDIQVKPRVEISKTKQKNIDLDVVRKKAYGTLEDDIETTLDRPLTDFYKKEESISEEVHPAKTIDELLIDSMDEDEVIVKPKKREFEEGSLNETFKLDEIIGEMKKSSKEIEKADDEDLFNLIDSMYSDKEDLDN